MNRSNLASRAFLVAAGIFLNTSAHAADSINDLLGLSLEQLVDYKIEAPTRTSLPVSETPGAVSVLTYEELHAHAAQTIPEMLRLVPGMNVRWNPMVQTMDMRGFGSSPFTSKILLLIDGVPYNSWDKGGFPQHPGFDFFNLQNVKHLEVLRGGGSALYGENAFNGIINIVTLSGEEVQQTRVSLYGGDRATRSASIMHGSRVGNDGSIFLSARRMHSQFPTELWTTDAKDGVNATDVFVKGKYKGLQLSFYRRADDFAGFSHDPHSPLLPPGSRFASAKDISQRVDIYAAQFDHSSADDRWTVKFNASRASRYGTHCAACHAPTQSPEFADPEDHGYQHYVNLQVGLKAFAHHDIILGAEARKLAAGDHLHELEGGEDLGGAPNPAVVGSYTKQAAYLQDRMVLLDNKLSIVAGLRYESATSPKLFGSRVFPRAAVVFKPNDKLTLRAGWSQAARYPSFSELYVASWFLAAQTPFGSIPLSSFKPNLGLKPEAITGTDFGVEYHFNDIVQAKLDLFENHLRDFIVVAYPNIRFENHPNKARVRGFEFELRAIPSPRWSVFANYAMQQNSQTGNGTDSGGNPIEFTYSPRNKINAGVTWSPDSSLTATLDASWRDRYMAPKFWYPFAFPTNPVPRALPSYVYLNARVSYGLPLMVRDGVRPLTLSVNARNLLDKRVFETLTGFGGRAMGREVFVGLQYDFAK